MLTEEDIKNLVAVFATKDDLNNLREELVGKIDGLHVAIDAYATKADNYFAEMVALAHKVDRHEKWLHALAEKLNVRLEY